MLNIKKTQHLKDLEKLSTQELEAILRNDFDQVETTDTETILAVLTILKNREKRGSETNDVEEAWQQFQQHYNTAEGRHMSLYPCEIPELPKTTPKRNHAAIIRRIAAVAAVICLVLLVALPVSGTESIWDIVGKWTSSIFRFADVEANPNATLGTVELYFENEDLLALSNEVAMCGPCPSVVPQWIPEGFVKTEITSKVSPQYSRIVGEFCLDDRTMVMTYVVYENTESMKGLYEKSDTEVSMFEESGIMHYLFVNNGENICCWVNGNIECYISGDISEQELRQIVHSIYSEVKFVEEDH